jgi:arylsulfatase A-like enzyme
MKIILALIALLLFTAHPASAQGPTRQPNVLLILVDDMGYGDPGCYNPQSKIATPQIDRLARAGMRFTDAHAPGALCHPSRYGLLTGQHPFRTDVSKWPRQPLIGENQATLASVMKSRGYRTAMVGKWHLGFQESRYDKSLPGGPADRGFDSFFGFRASTDIPPYFYLRGDRAEAPPNDTMTESLAHPSEGWSPIQGKFWRGGGIAPGLKLEDVLPRLTQEAVSVIADHPRTHSGQPLFLYFAATGPHTPWLPSKEFQGRSAAGPYGDFTMMVDAMIGRLLQALEDSRLADNTLVIFTSDNGPVWYPEDVKRTGHDAAGGLRGMKSSHWEGGHRMPFIVRWPGKVKAGSLSRQLICFTDVMATLADAAGAGLPADAGPDSFSFLRVLLGKQPENKPVRESLVIGNSIRSGAWKWIEGHEPALFMRPESGFIPAKTEAPGQLFNLADDPRETTNLAAPQPEIVARLQSELARIRKGADSRRPSRSCRCNTKTPRFQVVQASSSNPSNRFHFTPATPIASFAPRFSHRLHKPMARSILKPASSLKSA